ncbi:MAG: inositol monophosphatase [Chlamydiales bacterium]|nr:inositol monophosphatase [Chlamydiales bacterium]
MNLPEVLRSRLTVVATQTALKAGQLLRRGFGTVMAIDSKEGRHNLVTEWDKKSEALIIETIQRHFPDHSFLAEEGGETGKNEGIKWVIDPLDGTVNFAHNIPLFAVSIAATFDGEPLAGAVYNPMLEELFVAEKGQGAFLNGQEIKVTETSVLDRAILGTGFPYNTHENPLNALDLFHSFAKLGLPLRRMGSAAMDLCYLAAGRFDAFWEVSLEPWDYAAGKLIVEEAGGTVSDLEGNPLTKLKEGPLLASNGHLHSQMVNKIKQTIDHAAD